MGQVPAIAHFIWLGERLQWVHALAMRSAAARGGFDAVVLHHDRDLSHLPLWSELLATPRVQTRLLDPRALLSRTGDLQRPLEALYAELDKPEARANVLRAALLFAEGGVYLDTDTVTIADVTPLRAPGGAFCGAERLIKPSHVARDPSAATRVASFLRSRVRDGLARVPQGWRAFRVIESFYPLAVNNAVLGCEAQHAFAAALLERMVATPAGRRGVRYALGTHLLQEVVHDYRGADLRVLGPEHFYPLGPEISMHWFRSVPRSDLSAVLYPETSVVHWYASVRNKRMVAEIDADYVRRHQGRQLFSDLAAPFLSPVSES